MLAAGLLAHSNWKYAGRLREERALTQLAINEAKAANAKSALAELAAKEAQRAARVNAQVASKHAAKARAAEAKRSPVEAAESWRLAYESQLQATANLQAAIDTLAPALAAERAASAKLQGSSQNLVNATSESFWKRLVPQPHVGVTAGINPQGKPDVVAGIGLGWEF